MRAQDVNEYESGVQPKVLGDSIMVARGEDSDTLQDRRNSRGYLSQPSSTPL